MRLLQRVLKFTKGLAFKLVNSTPVGTETKQARTSEESVQGVRNPSSGYHVDLSIARMEGLRGLRTAFCQAIARELEKTLQYK